MKFKTVLSFMIGSLILLMFSCSTPVGEPMVDHAKVKEDITTVTKSWSEAINKKDMEAELALFAEDVKIFPPNRAPEIGKAVVKANMKKNMAQDSTVWSIDFSTNEVFAGGDHVTELGSWTVSGADGKMMDKGNYITIYEKKDGKYLVIRDIYNSEMELPKPAPMAEATDTEMDE